MVYYKNPFWGHSFPMLLQTYIIQLVFQLLYFCKWHNTFHAIKSPHDSPLFQSDTVSICGWCTANFMLVFKYKLYESYTNHTDSNKYLGVFSDWSLLPSHADCMCSHSCPFFSCLLMTYFAFITPKLKEASVIWNSINTSHLYDLIPVNVNNGLTLLLWHSASVECLC